MRRALLSLVPSSIVGTIALIIGRLDAWQRLGVPLGDRNFGDLHVIMLAATCAADDPTWMADNPPCVVGIEHYNYPSIWAKSFGMVGAGPEWTAPVAAALIVAFLVAVVPLTWLAIGPEGSVRRTCVMTIALSTPPIWLAFQRGNIDTLIFVIVVGSVLLWINRLPKSAGIAIALATTLKVFPIGAALMLLDRGPKRGQAITAFVVAAGIGFVAISRDLPTISARTPQIDGASFGVGLLPLLMSNQLNLDLSLGVTRVIGFLLLAGLTLIAWRVFGGSGERPLHVEWQQFICKLRVDLPARSFMLAGSGTFLVAYVAGPSYDYRQIFLLPVLAALLRIGGSVASLGAAVLIGLLIASYSTFIGPWEYLGDLLMLVVAPVMAVCVWQVLSPSLQRKSALT